MIFAFPAASGHGELADSWNDRLGFSGKDELTNFMKLRLGHPGT